MDESYALAIDLGASSGKMVVGRLEGDRAAFELTYRFDTRIVRERGKLYWDFLNMLHEIKRGYVAAQNVYDGGIRSLAIDSWCNDYALLTKGGTMIEAPRNYRDLRTKGWIERAGELMPKYEVYKKTGQQFARFETCYHLLAQSEQDPELLEIANELLFVPDYLSHLLGAKKYTEYTIASVTNLYNINENVWDEDILSAYGIKRSLFLPVLLPGEKVGRVSDEVCDELKTVSADIYTVGSHDTACAVAAAPVAHDNQFLFISSGTWSLVGAEIKKPITSPASMEAGFGNEGGVGGRIRYLKSIMGLWVLQECVRTWEVRGKKYDFAELAREARKMPFIDAYIDPDDELFFEPKDMPRAIADRCERGGYTVKDDIEVVQIILQSLACKYRYVFEQLERLTQKNYDEVYVLGGGSKNAHLNQLTADITGKRVVAGLPEATAIGNVITQWIGRGMISNLSEAREIVRNSCELTVYTPKNEESGEKMYKNFRRWMDA